MMRAVRKPETTSPMIGDLPTANPRRSLIFLAVGATVGLVLAGYSLFTAKGTATHTIPAEDIALVNQRPILMIDFVSQLQSVYGVSLADATAEQRGKILDDMIREELLVQRGLELDFPESDPDVRTALVTAVEQQVAGDVAAEQPTDADLAAYYAQHQDRFSSNGVMAVHDLVLASGDKDAATAAVAALRGGATLADIKARYGFKESGRTQGEEFYFAAKAHLGDALYAAATALTSGQIGDPVAQPDGLHVLAMDKNTPPVPLAFPDARERVVNDYRRDAETRVQQQDERYLRAKADIRIAPGYR
jgi:parvulin-like peptidyl-prolyl isomerase